MFVFPVPHSSAISLVHANILIFLEQINLYFVILLRQSSYLHTEVLYNNQYLELISLYGTLACKVVVYELISSLIDYNWINCNDNISLFLNIFFLLSQNITHSLTSVTLRILRICKS